MADLTKFEWQARPRNYDLERRKLLRKAELTSSHPLQELTVTSVDLKTKKQNGPLIGQNSDDPLSRTFDGADPLSMFAAEAASSSRTSKNDLVYNKTSKTTKAADDSLEPWSMRRTEILNRYTTAEKLSIVMILSPSSSENKDAGGGAVSDKVKNRLEQLDDLEEGSVQETLSLTQQEYIKRIEVSVC